MTQEEQNNKKAIKLDDCKKNLSKINQEIAAFVEDQTVIANPIIGERTRRVVKNFMASIPQEDEVETMLLGQMLATHNLAMIMLCRAGVEYKAICCKDFAATNGTVKLLNAFTRQMETLKSYRGKTSTQKIIVEQVKVESGGQAIVGNVQTGGGGEGEHGTKK